MRTTILACSLATITFGIGCSAPSADPGSGSSSGDPGHVSIDVPPDDAGSSDDAATGDDGGVTPSPATQARLDGGAYVMTLTNGTKTFDFIIVADEPSGTNALDAVHAGWSLVAPPDPTFATHINLWQSQAACGYADALDGLDPTENPCFGPGTSNVVDIATTSSSGEKLQGKMSWNALGFVRNVLDEPDHVTVTTQTGTTVGLKVVRTEHVGVGVAFSDTGGDDVKLAADVDFGAPTLDFSGKTLWSGDGITLSLGQAKLVTKPSLHTALGLAGGKLQHLKVEIDDELSASLSVKLSSSGAYDRTFSQRVFSFSKTLPPIDVAGVPLVETLRLDVDARCHVSVAASISAEAGVTLNEHLALGVEWTDGKWTNLSTVSAPTLSPIGPTLSASASSTIQCDLVPAFTVLFYDLVGPSLTTTASANLYAWTGTGGAHSLEWKLDADFKGVLGVATNTSIPFVGDALSKELGSANVTLFDYPKTLATGTL